MNTHDSIKVGSDASYKRLGFEISGHAVWHKTRGDGSESWIVALVPDVRACDAVPSSVLAEFKSPFAAVSALRKWAETPPAPKRPRKVKNPTAGSCRRNSTKPKPRPADPQQTEFELNDPRKL